MTPRPRAVVVVTGSELVRGERRDLNGPFLARELLSNGFEPARILLVGDGEEELTAALREGLEAEVCVVSGGLGPTHDDRTIEILARAAGRELRLDAELEQEIGGVSRRFAERMGRPYTDFESGVRKQATLPQGALSLGLAGTAPGVVLALDGRIAVALPGPPSELQRLWPRALETEPFRRMLERAAPPERRVLRFYGASESAIAKALADAGGEAPGVEATICARDFEIHVDLVVEPGAESVADQLERAFLPPIEPYLFSRDERPVEEVVLGLCRARRLTLATAESCTGGLVAARLTSVPGSSEVFVGGVVAYSNDVKRRELDVAEETLEAYGAVSEQTAVAMGEGARARLRVDIAVAVTGVAGPGGGTEEKPVGLVYLHAVGPDGAKSVSFSVPSDRESIRRRAAVAGLHLVRRLLTQSRDIRV